ncbi:hypothetical protein [Nocardiopsis sp. CNT312]|uniref:hypothetical protein n=1 Tax=Nocardiopsis sp. CNT312 TaxID=1137268 RepID=UPI00048B589D|nr:hypothetical protein [Nocardiopsis sp. CNT312]
MPHPRSQPIIRATAGLAVIALTVSHAPHASAQTESAPHADTFQTTVLDTGDTVSVSPDGAHVAITPAEGREGTRFTSVHSADRHLVLPGDLPRTPTARLPTAAAARTPASSGTGCGSTECHELSVRHLGPDGAPTDDAESMVLGLDSDVMEFAGGSESAVFSLPEGRYMLVTDVSDFTDPDADWHRMVHPLVTLDSDDEVVMDATTTRPVSTDPGADGTESALVEIGVENQAGSEAVRVSLQADDFSGLHTALVGPSAPVEGLTSFVASTWAHRDRAGELRGSPETVHLLDTVEGSFPTGYDRTVEPDDLATVAVDHFAQTPGNAATKALFASAPGVSGIATVFLPYDLPSSTVHRVEAGETMWSSAFGENRAMDDGTVSDVTALGSVPRSYEAGDSYTERWNAAVVGPMFLWGEHAVRSGDDLWFGMPMYSDQDRHQGGSVTDEAEVLLFQDGGLVASSDTGHLQASLAPGESELRLESRTSRASVADLSTRIEAEWTVSSDTAAPEGERLPLWVVRYQPRVDMWNSVRARGLIRIPLTVEAHPDSVHGDVEELTVQASFDDGDSWKRAWVIRHGADRRTALIWVPRRSDAEYLSLRAHLTDSDDNSVEQTIIRALRLSD